MLARFNWPYRSSLGTWGNGEVVEMTPELYAALNADSPGVVSEYTPPVVAADSGPQDGPGDVLAVDDAADEDGERQVVTARNRGRPKGSRNRSVYP